MCLCDLLCPKLRPRGWTTQARGTAAARLAYHRGAGSASPFLNARHAQHNDREKLTLRSFETRFLNEARAVNIVQHPSLINIFEFGRLDDGTAYIIMEYLEGETLRHRLVRSGGRLGSDAVRITRQIASALAAAHAKGIVHREQSFRRENLQWCSPSRFSVVIFGERARNQRLRASPHRAQDRARAALSRRAA